jgi:hypothetical protein
MKVSAASLLLALVLAALSIGCGGSPAAPAPDLAAERARLLLAEEPEGVLPVLAVRDVLAQQSEVVVVGRIGGMANPWDEGRASFVITDPSVDAAEGHECTDAGCAFCKHKNETASDALAVVQFVDPAGNVLPIDARQLFDVAADQMVVVRGRAKVDALGHLVLAADGLYIRR